MGFLTEQGGKALKTALPVMPQEVKKTLVSLNKQEKLVLSKPEVTSKSGFDVAQLCRAIAEHETHNCEDGGNSVAVNNCHGFRVAGKFLPFKTKAESYAKCEKLWMSAYSGGLPTLADAQKWSGNDRAYTWQKNVIHFYYSL